MMRRIEITNLPAAGRLEDSRAESIARFIEKVREGNSGYKAVISIMDNFKSHTSSLVKERAKELAIHTCLQQAGSLSPSLFSGS